MGAALMLAIPQVSMGVGLLPGAGVLKTRFIWRHVPACASRLGMQVVLRRVRYAVAHASSYLADALEGELPVDNIEYVG